MATASASHTTKQKPTEKRLEILEKADEIALYYGFTPIDPFRNTSTAIGKILREFEQKGDFHALHSSFCVQEKILILNTYLEKNMAALPQPVLLYYRNGATLSGKKKSKEKEYGLEIIGTNKSIAEAILIKTALAILTEEGFTDLFVKINSVGDKDSSARFCRELVNYYRKNINLLPADCRQAFKKEALDVLGCSHEKCQIIRESAPKSLGFLTEYSRHHLKEVLEYLETMDVPYHLDHSLVGKRCCSETIFEIHSKENSKPLALGVRYDSLVKRMGYKKEIPAAGIKLFFEPKVQQKKIKSSKTVKKPKFYFIQLGFEAKLKSLQVIEVLRQAKIPLYQSLSKDKLAGQMAIAENLKIPYAIIMGQKEAMENSVIVRHMNTRSQETVKIPDLPKYLESM